jgi:hypothetical protein
MVTVARDEPVASPVPQLAVGMNDNAKDATSRMLNNHLPELDMRAPLVRDTVPYSHYIIFKVILEQD